MPGSDSLQVDLSAIADVLLNESSSPGALLQSTSIYLKGLEAVCSVEIFRFQPVRALMLSSGKAIDPFSAAHCIADYYRTTQFIRALYQAIMAAQRRFGDGPIHVFYVGTGPYAALMLPLTTRFSPQQVQFTLVEAHPVTYDLLTRTIDQLGLYAWVKQTVLQDATQIQLAGHDPVHILVTETMQSALKKEPQVAITRHLAPQLSPDAFFLPEKIHVWAGLSNPANSYQKMMNFNNEPAIFVKPLGTLMELTRDQQVNKEDVFPVISVELPPDLTTDFPLLSLYTDIEIFDGIKLMSDECVITLHQPVIDLQKSGFNASVIDFQYTIVVEQGFRYFVKP